MNLHSVLIGLVHILVKLFAIAWDILVILIDILDTDQHHDNTMPGNHFIIGGDEFGEESDIFKRAGNHYIDDRDTALYDRDRRH